MFCSGACTAQRSRRDGSSTTPGHGAQWSPELWRPLPNCLRPDFPQIRFRQHLRNRFSWTVAHHTRLKSVQHGGYRKLSSGGGFFFFCEMRFKRPKLRSYRMRQYHESAPRFSLERNGCNSDTRNHGDRVQPLSPVWDAPMFLSALSSATFSDDPECGQTRRPNGVIPLATTTKSTRHR